MARGMPQHAKLLRDLLDDRERIDQSQQVWKSSASEYFVNARADAGMNQTELAKQLAISLPYLNQIEHGNRTPSAETVERLLTFVEGEADANTDEGEAEED